MQKENKINHNDIDKIQCMKWCSMALRKKKKKEYLNNLRKEAAKAVLTSCDLTPSSSFCSVFSPVASFSSSAEKAELGAY